MSGVGCRRSIGLAWWTVLLLGFVVLGPGCAALGYRTLRPELSPGLAPLSQAACTEILSDPGDPETLRQAAQHSLGYLRRAPDDQTFVVFDTPVTIIQLRRGIEIVLEEISAHPDTWTAEVCRRLQLYRATAGAEIITTGYYTPVLPASRVRTDRFRYPLYRRPADLITADLGPYCPACAGATAAGRVEDGRLVPYYSRAEIEAGALGDSAEVIAWADDPVEVFFLHIQGSGVLEFDDGTRVAVGYAGSNGRPYRSIGKKLVDDGEMTLEQASMQSLKAYLRTHPDRQTEILQFNERYAFFEPRPEGAVGSLGFPVTPGRSLAADSRVYPPGALMLLQLGSGSLGSEVAGTRLVLIQDAGAAITGPARLDLYVGTGEDAGEIAGRLRAPTELYLLLPRHD